MTITLPWDSHTDFFNRLNRAECSQRLAEITQSLDSIYWFNCCLERCVSSDARGGRSGDVERQIVHCGFPGVERRCAGMG